MIKIDGHYVIPKLMVQNVINLVRACQPVGEVTNGDVLDVMGTLSAVLRSQDADATATAKPSDNGDPKAETPSEPERKPAAAEPAKEPVKA